MAKISLDSLIEDVKKVEDVSSPNLQWSQNDEDFQWKYIEIDGYSVVFLFKRYPYDAGNNFFENLKLKSLYGNYLPFHIVAKLGKKFLGSHHLRLVEHMEGHRKIYEWRILVDSDGKPVEVELQDYIRFEECTYDDLNYTYIYM